MYAELDIEPPPPPSGMNCPDDFSIPSGISHEDVALIKLTAQFVARYGKWFSLDLVQRVIDDYPQFHFLHTTDHRFPFYNGLVLLYQRLFKPLPEHMPMPLDTWPALKEFFILVNMDVDDTFFPCLDDNQPDLMLLASVDGLDSFSHLEDPEYSVIMPPPQPLSVMVKLLDHVPPPSTAPLPVLSPPPHPFFKIITPEELAVIKSTAMFVARYGKHFLSALMRSVVTNPRFRFLFFNLEHYPQFHSMEPPEIMYYYYLALVDSYSKVLMPSKKLKKKRAACAEPVLEFFFQRLQCQKLEEGDETAVTDLLAFVSGLDIFARIEDPHYPTRTDTLRCPAVFDPPLRLSVIDNRPTHIYPAIIMLLPHRNIQPPPDFVPMSHPPFISEMDIATTFPSSITLRELGIIKLAAQFVCRYGSGIAPTLENKVATDPLFPFLKENGRRSPFYGGLLTVYRKVIKPSSKVLKCPDGDFAFFRIRHDFFKLAKRAAMIELNAFTSGADFFAHMDDPDFSSIMPPPQLFSEMTQMHPATVVQLPHRAQNQDNIRQVPLECVGNAQPSLDPTLRPLCSSPFICHDWDATPEELSIIKLTALFMVRYGKCFWRDLVKKVGIVRMEHRFKFMEPTDRRFRFYNIVVVAYSRVLLPCDDRLYRETVLERYFECFEWKNGPKIDWHAFVEGVDYFARMEDDDYSDLLLKMKMSRYQVRYHDDQFESPSKGMIRPPAPLTLPEEPEPKRQKIEESGLVPEDQFLAQHPGSSTIKAVIRHWWHPMKSIEMTVKSLSENVESLKEKIAGEIKAPAKKLKLIGKAGYLKNDKSLAHYNVGDGEMLTLTWSFSRWS